MKKSLTALLTAALLTLLTAPCRAVDTLPEESFSLACDAAVLVERQTGALLYAKNAHQRLSPASVTKVMTLLLVAEAVEGGVIAPEELVTVSRRAASMGGSQVWLEEGERLSVAELTKCVAVVSANDCAVALAERLCGSEEAFVARMNDRAAELQLPDTHFTNCTGLFEDPDHYTSAWDVALISRELLRHDLIRQYTCLWMDSIRDGAFGLTNTNKLVRYYDGCTGLKTGFTATAMFCLTASAQRDGVEYVAVVLHGDSSQERFDAARTLLDWAFANCALVTPAPEAPLPTVAVELGSETRVRVVCADAGPVLIEKARRGALEGVVSLAESVRAPVEAGQQLGTYTLLYGDEVVAVRPLTAETAVPRLSLPQVWLRLCRALLGRETA